MIRVLFSQKKYFAQMAKKLKPQQIDFTFNLPKKKITDQIKQQIKQEQVNVFKLKRSDVSRILKKKQLTSTEKEQVQKQYQQAVKQKIEQNLKTKNYHQSQYFKGEHLIDNVPLNPYYQYKLADFKRKVQKKREQLKSFFQPYIDLQKRADLRESTAQDYHEKQTKYQKQEFAKYLDQYPGSPKGPKPQDDIDYYITYALKKIPQTYLNELKLKSSTNELRVVSKVKEQVDDIYFQANGNTSDIFGQKRNFNQQTMSKYKFSDVFSMTQDVPIQTMKSQMPQIPRMQFKNYHQYMGQLINWRNFTNHYKDKNGMNDLKKQMEIISKIYQENDEDPQSEYFALKPSIPSLYRYYKTLPKSVQDHPGIKDVYLGLQYKSPDWTYQQKQDALNFAATLAMPLDKISKKAMEDFVSNDKFRLTPSFVDKVYKMNPQFTWDLQSFLNEIKQQQLRGQSMIKQAQQKYPQPPPIHLQWEQGTANLPVDYYDNDDGFWDSIISQKLKRYDEAKPMIKVRKHFLH